MREEDATANNFSGGKNGALCSATFHFNMATMFST